MEKLKKMKVTKHRIFIVGIAQKPKRAFKVILSNLKSGRSPKTFQVFTRSLE